MKCEDEIFGEHNVYSLGAWKSTQQVHDLYTGNS